MQDYRQRDAQEDEHIVLNVLVIEIEIMGRLYATRVLEKRVGTIEGHIKNNQHSRELGDL